MRRLIRHGAPGPFGRNDADDLRQELCLHVVQQREHYDPTRSSPHTFIDRITSRKLVDLVLRANAHKRGGGGRLHRLPNERSEDALSLARDDPSLHALPLRLDVELAMADLPEDLTPVARLLMNDTPAGVMRQTGLSREQFRGVKRHLAQHFRERGLS